MPKISKTLPLIIDQKEVYPQSSQVVTNFSHQLNTDYVAYTSATVEDAIAAAESSQEAFQSWSNSLPRDRRNILQKTARLVRENVEELVKIQMEETNSLEFWARNAVEWTAAHLEEIAGRITSAMEGEIPVIQTPGQVGLVYKRPVGPVLSIPPWNTPLFLACRSIDTPLAVGCTVVLKASEQSPHVHHYLARLFNQAGLPPGVLNVIQTRREDAAQVCEALIAHRAIRKIEFIGSAPVGRHLGALAGKYLKPMLMELGGKAAAVILDDADLELAARAVVHGGTMHHGQICFSTERIIVAASVVDKFIPILLKAAEGIQPFEAISPTGPRRSLQMLEDAKSKGAKLVYGKIGLATPCRLEPVILTDVTPNMTIYDEESFGPVLILSTVSSDEEAIKAVNRSIYGLAAGVFSTDVNRALSVARQLEVGQTHINFPFGTGTDEATLSVGISKSSGWGKQNSSYGMNEFLELRAVTITEPSKLLQGLQNSS